MSIADNKLKTISFWLRLGVINHLIATLVVLFAWVYSSFQEGFQGRGEAMKEVLSIYAFTLLTPQIALEVIIILALFLIISSMRDIVKNLRGLVLFFGTLSAPIIFMYLQ